MVDVSSHTCPACWRYGSSDMRDIWLEESKLQKSLYVESALSGAQAGLGIIPEDAAREISRKATTKYVTPEAVWKREQEIKHDVMAMVEELTRVCEGDAGKYVHLDATSYDIEDNRLSVQIRDASALILDKITKFGQALRERAEEYKSLPAIGRTHGQWAEPITFGFKYAKYLNDAINNYRRLLDFMEKYLFGKPMTGAVGTSDSYAFSAGAIKARKIGEAVMKKLGLNPALITDQVIQRDMHAQALDILSYIALDCAKFAWEVWNLQRPEIGEVWERSYTAGQVGSSTMPHKRNPINCENIISLSRVVKGFSGIAKDNIPLLHERDLSNSAAERVIIPQSFIYTDEILLRSARIAKNMAVREKNIRRNLERAEKFTITEPLMLKLAERGLGRQDAHLLLREYSEKLYNNWEADPIKTLLGMPEIKSRLTRAELESAFENHMAYTGLAEEYIEDVIKESKMLD